MTTFIVIETNVAQSDIELLELTFECLIIEFNKEKYKEFISSKSSSPRTVWSHRKIPKNLDSQEALQPRLT